MENRELKQLLDEIGALYGELTAIHQTMALTLDDMYQNLKMPEHYLDAIKMDRHVLDRQTASLKDCIMTLERIAPNDCYLG